VGESPWKFESSRPHQTVKKHFKNKCLSDLLEGKLADFGARVAQNLGGQAVKFVSAVTPIFVKNCGSLQAIKSGLQLVLNAVEIFQRTPCSSKQSDEASTQRHCCGSYRSLVTVGHALIVSAPI
jgi:hypothetical protein